MQMIPATPQTYYLLRWVEIGVVANGYQVTAKLPTIAYDGDGDLLPHRVWGIVRLVYLSYSDVSGWVDNYFSCPADELDRMADRYYRHDITGESERQSCSRRGDPE